VLVEAPPNSGKTTSALRIAAAVDKPVTYISGRTDLYREAQQQIEQFGATERVTAQTIPSPHRDCDTFAGEYGGAEAERVRRLYSKGVSGYKIHYSRREGAYTPCMQGKTDYEYIDTLEQVEHEIDDTDILIGHHSHISRQKYVADRIVIVDEFILSDITT